MLIVEGLSEGARFLGGAAQAFDGHAVRADDHGAGRCLQDPDVLRRLARDRLQDLQGAELPEGQLHEPLSLEKDEAVPRGCRMDVQPIG